MRRPEAWIIARGQALVVYGYAVIERLGIRNDSPCISGFAQEFPNELVLTDRVGTGQLDHAMQWLRQGSLGHAGSDILCGDGLHQSWWDANRLPFRRRLGDAAHELEELRGTDNRIR